MEHKRKMFFAFHWNEIDDFKKGFCLSQSSSMGFERRNIRRRNHVHNSNSFVSNGLVRFVDFAGWEQAKATGAKGEVLGQATFINSQLLSWSQCLGITLNHVT